VPPDDFMIEELWLGTESRHIKNQKTGCLPAILPAGTKRGKQPYWPMAIMRMSSNSIASNVTGLLLLSAVRVRRVSSVSR
jgi:hypothetical protein